MHKQDAKFDFKVHYDSDGRAIIDIKEGDKWFREAQQILKLNYKDKNCSKKELIQWLDKKLRFIMIDKEDKVKFLEKVIDEIKGCTIQDLSINRYVLFSQLDELIYSILIEYTKKRFDKLLKEGKIKLVDSEKFPEVITLSEELLQDFNKNYYAKIDKLNKEEEKFIGRLDLNALPNIKFWIRNKKEVLFICKGGRKISFIQILLQ